MNIFEHARDLDINRLPAVQERQVYAVGGCVRDLLLGKQPQDYDLAVTTDPKDFATRMAANLQGRRVILGRPGQRIYRIVTPNTVFDVASIAGATIESDLRRRDFTVNAMACDLATGELIDCSGGQRDLRRGLVRMVSADGFRQDPLRMIRAYRLAAQFAWKLDPATAAAITVDKQRIRAAAAERIWDELRKILSVNPSRPVLDQMIAIGLLTEILPELQAVAGIRIGARPLFSHLLSACGHLERLLANPAELAPGNAVFTEHARAEVPAALLKLSLLLHAIGSPQGSKRAVAADPADRAAESARRICRRLRTSCRQADYIEFILRNHRRPLRLYQHCRDADRVRGARVRFFLDCHPRVADIVLHATADRFAECADNGNRDPGFANFVRVLLDEYYRDIRPLIEASPLLTGNDLIEAFHLKPSPLFRHILEGLTLARLAGEVRNRTEALQWVRARVGGQKPSG